MIKGLNINHMLQVMSLLMISASAQADLVGTWSVANSQTFTVYYKDNNHIRMDVGNGTYLLIQGEKTYTVMNQGGRLMVMDLAAMGGAMQAYGGGMHQQMQQQVSQYDPSSVKYENTGKKETVAGYPGEVYQLTVNGPQGKEQAELVLSKHKNVVTFQRAFMSLSQKMAQSMMSRDTLNSFNDAAKMAEVKNMGGMLRYNQQMRLQSLEDKAIDASFYALPKNAMMMSIPGFPGK
ncbi:MAG: DUF4412 domain-containing protein [Pseudomonadales bacterium]|nr:DUF4412 domain-containing protein [Pseudomonadales bacterium]